MRWISKKRIHKTMILTAIDLALEHWQQLAKATNAELQDGIAKRKTSIKDNFCALCFLFARLQHPRCSQCPLKSENYKCCINWKKAGDAFDEWKKSQSYKKHKAFQQAAERVCNKLQRLRGEILKA